MCRDKRCFHVMKYKLLHHNNETLHYNVTCYNAMFSHYNKVISCRYEMQTYHFNKVNSVVDIIVKYFYVLKSFPSAVTSLVTAK